VAEEKPVVYILHGDDDFGLNKFITGMIAKLGDPSLADLNITRLDGRNASDDDLRTAVYSMPFLTERRLVIYTNPLARLNVKGARQKEAAGEEVDPAGSDGPVEEVELSRSTAGAKGAREKFLSILDGIPATTALVLAVNDYMVRRKGEWEWETLSPGHWLIKWSRQAAGRAIVREFALPRVEEMPAWIRKQAQSMGGQFSPQGALVLAEHIGSDTLAAAQEVNKLLTYVNFKRPVEGEDVELLTAQAGLVDVFKMVDALAERNATQTLKLLHGLLETSEPPEVFGMIVRQFRLLLQAREILDEGGGVDQIQAEVIDQRGRVHPYVARKLSGQAAHFSLEMLEAIHRRLLELDLAMKTSQMSFEYAMDTLIAELTQA